MSPLRNCHEAPKLKQARLMRRARRNRATWNCSTIPGRGAHAETRLDANERGIRDALSGQGMRKPAGRAQSDSTVIKRTTALAATAPGNGERYRQAAVVVVAVVSWPPQWLMSIRIPVAEIAHAQKPPFFYLGVFFFFFCSVVVRIGQRRSGPGGPARRIMRPAYRSGLARRGDAANAETYQS